MKQKRNILVTGLAVTLAAATLLGGATYAYLRSETEDVVNTFNANQVTVSLAETTGASYDIIPGTVQQKDPTVTVNNTVDAYVFVEVTDKTEGLVTYAMADGWQLLEGYDSLYYRVVAADAADKTFAVLQNNQVAYDTALANSDMVENGVLKTDLALTFKALAIQQGSFDTAAKAYLVAAGKWDGTVDTDWYDGEQQTFAISSPAQLAGLAQLVNSKQDSFAGKTITLTADVDLNGVAWTPIGVDTFPFKGTVDGGGHTIKNMAIESNAAKQAFIARATGFTVKNITFDSAKILGTSGNMRAVVGGYIDGGCTLENVTVKNSEVRGFGKVAGLLGITWNTAKITGCRVENTQLYGVYECGGLIGLSFHAYQFTDCSVDNVVFHKMGNENDYYMLDTTVEATGAPVTGEYWKYADTDGDWYYGVYGDFCTYVSNDNYDKPLTDGGFLADGTFTLNS